MNFQISFQSSGDPINDRKKQTNKQMEEKADEINHTAILGNLMSHVPARLPSSKVEHSPNVGLPPRVLHICESWGCGASTATSAEGT